MRCGTRWLHRSLIHRDAGKEPISWSKETGRAEKLAARGILMRGVVHGEAWKFTLAGNGFIFKSKGFESSIQLLVCMTLLGFIAFLCGATNVKKVLVPDLLQCFNRQ